MTYTLGIPSLNDGHQFKGEPDIGHYNAVCRRRRQEGIKNDTPLFPDSSLYRALSPTMRARLADNTLLELFLHDHVSSTQLETLSDSQCRVLIGFSKAILDGRLTTAQALEQSLSAARVFHLIEEGRFSVLNCKNQLLQLSDEQVNDEVMSPIIDSGAAVGYLYELINSNYLTLEEARGLASTQAKHLKLIYPTHSHMPFSQVKPLLRSDPAFRSCIDNFSDDYGLKMLSSEELCALTPDEAKHLMREGLFDYPYNDRDWARMKIFKYLGWPIRPVDEADKSSSRRQQLLATGYFSEADLMTITHHEAKILLKLSNELQQEGLSFAEARPLLTWNHEHFIDRFGPHASGEINMKLRDIARLTCDEVREVMDREIMGSAVYNLKVITEILGYAPILNGPSPSISAPHATQSERVPLALPLPPRHAFWKQEPESDEAFHRAIDRVALD